MGAMVTDPAVQMINALATPELMEPLHGPSLTAQDEHVQLELLGSATLPTPTMRTPSLNAQTRACVTERPENAHASPTTTALHANALSAPTRAAMLVSASPKDNSLLRPDAHTLLPGMRTCTLVASAILDDVVLIAPSWSALLVPM